MLSELRRVDSEIYTAVRDEVRRQQTALELIASENYVSQAVLDAQGCVMTNKYAEGYPGARYYGGCEFVDVVESLAIERAKKIFGAEHANVQPHSGTQANLAVYLALLEPGDAILSMGLAHGGHLSHGYGKNLSGRMYKAHHYGVSRETEMIDMDEVREAADECEPRMIVVGASAYSREIDFAAFGRLARERECLLMADIAHIAGLVAAGLHPDPVPYCDVVTATTHKTMRGPRGGIILCKEQHARAIDAQVFPGTQGGPLMHVIAGKAVALKEGMSPGFRAYQELIVGNAKALCKALGELGFRIVAGGTDNHMFIVDLTSLKLTGKRATRLLEDAGITVNKNLIPHDPLPANQTSGIRLGTPALTTRGMKEPEMEHIAQMIAAVLKAPSDRDLQRRIRDDALNLCDRFPIYAGLLRRLYEQDRGAYQV